MFGLGILRRPPQSFALGSFRSASFLRLVTEVAEGKKGHLGQLKYLATSHGSFATQANCWQPQRDSGCVF
jgi:hypothetical protein